MMVPTPAQVRRVVKTALQDLGSTSGHHTFEELCVDLARRLVSSRIVLATGPVAAGGDQGRDAETLWARTAEEPQVVLACSLQRDRLPTKIERDVAAICARGSAVDRVIACTAADIEIAVQHRLEDWARREHRVELQVWDGARIAAQLATEELFWIAETRLHVDRMLGPARYRQITDLLEAHLRAIGTARRWSRSDGSQSPVIARRVQRVPDVDAPVVTGSELPLLDLITGGAGRSVLVVGEPGTGKTTAAQLLFERLASAWLDQYRHEDSGATVAYVPLYVRARDLTLGAASFSEMLGSASCIVAQPTAPVLADIFAARVDNVRWLVIVDGLDEVQSDTVRRALIQLLADRGTQQGAHRFVVMARPLAPSELRPLTKAGFLAFSLPRFSAAELQNFVGLLPTGHEGFLDQVEDPQLLEMLRVPLFADLAVRAVPLTSAADLPSNRLDLIELFLRSLRQPDDEDAAIIFDELLPILAEKAISGPCAFVSEAKQWHRRHFPDSRVTDDQLQQKLIRTGVLIATGDDMAFAHQAFAEYLTAKRRAAAMAADGTTLPKLIADLRSRKRANVTAYTVVLLLRSRPELATQAVRGLLASDGRSERSRGGLLAAAELILDGIPVDGPLRTWVINKLVDAAVNNERLGESVDFLDVLSRFGSYAEVIERLREILTSRHVGVPVRCKAAVHLALNGYRDIAESELKNLLSSAIAASAAIAIVDALRDITDDQHALVRASLSRWVDDPSTEPIDLVAIANHLHDAGEKQLAINLYWKAFERPLQSSFGHMEWAASLLLAIDKSTANTIFMKLGEMPGVSSFDKAEIAAVFAEEGHANYAATLAREALQDLSISDEATSLAIEAWMTARPDNAQEFLELLSATGKKSASGYFLTDVALALDRGDYGKIGILLLLEILRAPHANSHTLEIVGKVLYKKAPEDTYVQALRDIERHPNGGPQVVVRAAAGTRATVPERILPEILHLLRDPVAVGADTLAGMRVLVASGPSWAARGIHAFVGRPTVSDAALITITRDLVEQSHHDLARDLILRVMGSPLASDEDRHAGLTLLCKHFSRTEINSAVVALLGNPWLRPAERMAAASSLKDSGYHYLMLPILGNILTDKETDLAIRLEVLTYLSPDDLSLARTWVEIALHDAASAEATMLRRILAWLSVA